MSYLETVQLRRHNAVLNNTAPNPWQYRPLAEWILAASILATRALGVPRPEVTAMLGIRLLQNLLIFGVAANYYWRLGLSFRTVLLGLGILTWGMSHALYNSDLSFSTYFDLLYYLIAGWLIVSGHLKWILPLVVVAALNRETSGLIPLMLVGTLVVSRGRAWREQRSRVALAGIGLLLFAAVYLAVRAYFGPRTEPWPWHYSQGWPLVVHNLSDPDTLMRVALTLNVLPLIAVWRLRTLPRELQGFFWAVVPVWFAVHLAAVLANETRIFLVPFALIFVPAALYTSPPEVRGGRAEG